MWATETEKIAHFRATTRGCECPDNAQVWHCVDCPIHGKDAEAELEAQHAAEIWAENAWLRAAEAPTNEDYAFEQYESRMGLI